MTANKMEIHGDIKGKPELTDPFNLLINVIKKIF